MEYGSGGESVADAMSVNLTVQTLIQYRKHEVETKIQYVCVSNLKRVSSYHPHWLTLESLNKIIIS